MVGALPASAGADDGGEVGGAQQGVLGCAHPAPVAGKSLDMVRCQFCWP